MSKKNQLWLHQELMRLVHILGTDEENKMLEKEERGEETVLPPLVMLRESIPHSYVFDCRTLPTGFILDSGESFLEEPPEMRGPVRLPHPNCYFEFTGPLGIHALAAEGVTDESDKEIPVFAVPILYTVAQGYAAEGEPWMSSGSFMNTANEPVIQDALQSTHPSHKKWIDLGGKLVLGVLTLLRDRLLLNEAVPDPKPWVNKKRRALGKYPLSSARNILTVNVAAVKREAGYITLGHHESPALHWRRGHYRMLHRGTDDQKTTWVRRCLVGDPDRGFISHRDFKLIDDPGKVAVPIT